MKKDAIINLLFLGVVLTIVAIINYNFFTSAYFLFPVICLSENLMPSIGESAFIDGITGIFILFELILMVFLKRWLDK